MKVSSFISKLLTNKYVLYLVAFLAFTNVIGYLMMGNVNAVIYFILFGLITSYFSKNMIIVLLIALFVTNLLIVSKFGFKEGMENSDSSTNTENSKKKQPNTASSSGTNNMVDMNNDVQNNTQQEQNYNESSDENKTDESFIGTVNLDNKKGSRVDYASTIEDAYDNLNKIIGSEGMQKLTSDTQGLMKQQLQLAEAMKTMTPLIQNITPLLNQTKDMLGGMDMSHINNIASMAKNFTM